MMNLKMVSLICLSGIALAACGKKTDKIGEASTVFNMLGKNDRIEVEAFDDPDVQGLSCFLSYAKKGGLKETVNLEEDASDASVSCVQTAPEVRYHESVVAKPRKVFKRDASFAFKSLQIMRYYDSKRKAFAYMVYSDKILKGSPKNSLSAWACQGGVSQDAANTNVVATTNANVATATATTATATTTTNQVTAQATAGQRYGVCEILP